jgi:predicted ATP-dependent serine protease
MQEIQITNAQILKAEKRFQRSRFADKYQLKTPFNGTEYLFRGIWRSNREFIISSGSQTFLIPMENSNPSKPNQPSAIKEPRKIELVKIDDVHYDDRIFQSMRTGKPIDYMFSTEGGIYPATNYMVIGDPGIGKSTQTLDLLAKIVKNEPHRKVLFISGEMNQIDMYGYVKRYPTFGQIPTLFLCDYLDDDPKEILEQTFNQGWDVILIDSFIEVQESIQASSNMTRTAAEKWLIDMMVTHNKGNNEENLFTSFLAIQQVTKGGNFVGSNKLKHNTTGMIELRYSSEFSGDRYAKVTKNRRGFKYEKIYFSLDNPIEVEYDQKRLERDEEIRKRLQREKETLLSEEEKFNQLFGITENQLEETELVESVN